MYGKCGLIYEAQHLFDEMPHRTIFAWNALIGGYASNGQFCNAIKLYKRMRVLEVVPDACTFASVLKACAAVGDLYCGAEIHGSAVKYGLDSITFVANALVGMYAKCGLFDSAMRLFDRLRDGKDVVSWNSIISACCGRADHSFRVFERIENKDIEKKPSICL
ncbi:Pentatricopeptide repeat-containing protein, chloroplastic [Ananas comosus]|uniref:Pentatricopeptide repeat-containing protein, chloroplastic n=1 Tax=Ananas comosus TaxID=4615 RepID=A0A199VBL0_ANACO|nr:Pentatricopeptide repeat-containing protein, chloroplastic [Ananas comosus]